MNRRMSGWRKVGSLLMAGLMAAGMMSLGGCGGGYDTPVTIQAATTANTSGPIIDATTLKQWADQGKLNAPLGSTDRVVVLSVTTLANYTTVTKKHIPGALLMDSATDLYFSRQEGLAVAGSMMPSGANMDTVTKKLGIDNFTTIVLTIPKGSTDSQIYPQSVAFWVYRYWGFDRNRVKILNGGDDAWDLAGLPLVKTQYTPTPTTYSVAQNKALKDMVRYSFGEMLGLVDSINNNSAQLDGWQMLDVRGATVSPFMSNAKRGTPFQFFTRLNNDPARNWQYPDRETLLTRLSSIPVNNPDLTTSYLSPAKKTVVMCGSSISASPSFVLFDAVLGVSEGNIAMYDGSSGQWTAYKQATVTAAGATADQAALWAFDALTPGTALYRATNGTSGVQPTGLTGTMTVIPSTYTFSPFSVDMNQIENADKAYIIKTPSTTTGGGTTGGGSSGGGC